MTYKAEAPLAEPEVRPCPFCDLVRAESTAAASQLVFAIEDLYPVTEGHVLIIPRSHVPDLFSMTADERREAFDFAASIKLKIEGADLTVAGFNVGANCGVAAGQTVMHAHIHLIPRRPGDTPNPRSGVRGVVPGRMNY